MGGFIKTEVFKYAGKFCYLRECHSLNKYYTMKRGVHTQKAKMVKNIKKSIIINHIKDQRRSNIYINAEKTLNKN